METVVRSLLFGNETLVGHSMKLIRGWLIGWLIDGFNY